MIDESLKNKIKKAIDGKNIDKFQSLLKQKEILDEIRKEEEWNKKIQNQLNVWLEEQIIKNNEGILLEEYWETIEVYGILLKCGADKEIIYKQITKTIEKKDFNGFKFYIKELKDYGINLENIKKDKQLNEKLQKQLDSWLEEKCKEQEYISDIIFLLECESDKEIIYKQITKAIEKKDFNGFKFYIKVLKDYGINLKNVKKDRQLKEKLQKQLDSWLEEKYNDYFSDNEDVNFLLECGADKGITYKYLKKTIEEDDFYKLKIFKGSGIYLEEIRKDGEWNKKLQNKIDKWLEEKCQEHEEDEIKVLLECGADKEIIYKYLKKTIEEDDFYKFYFFVKKLKKYGINLEHIKKDKQLKEKLQKQLDSWLENIYKTGFEEDESEIERENYERREKNEEYDDEEYDDDERGFDSDKIFLLKCGARKEEVIKLSIENSHFKAFKNLVEEDKKLLEDLRKEKDWNYKIKKQLYSWLEKELEYNYVIKENINFLIQSGASEEEVLNNSIKQFNRTIFRNIIRRNILSREDIKGLKINNEVLIKELIEYIYEENGLETQTLENNIMKPDKFDEETKNLIIEIVKQTHLERANILKIRLNLV